MPDACPDEKTEEIIEKYESITDESRAAWTLVEDVLPASTEEIAQEALENDYEKAFFM